MRSRSNTVTTTGPGAGLLSSLPSSVSAACKRETPMEKPGRRHRLAAEARDEPVVAPAAADRAEAHRAAFLVFGVEQEFNFVDRAGVVFETADDGRIDHGSVVTVTCCRHESCIVAKLGNSCLS